MRLESRCYSSSAINNDSESALKIDTLKRVVHARNHNHNRNNTLENLKKEKNVNGILSFLQKFRVANKNYFVDSTFSLSSPQSSRRSNATDSRWQSIESVISSATATSFAFIPSHQLRLYGVREPTSDGFFRKYNLPEVNEEQTNINKFNRYSTGDLENTIGYDKNFNTHSNQETSTSEAVWIQKRKYCHKPGKRRAPQPPIEEQTNSKKIPYRRKKRKAPSPPRLMSSKDSLDLSSLEIPNEEDPKEKVRGPREEHTAVYNDSLKLEKGILKANKNSIEIPPNENGKLASAPVSPKPWYKRSVTKNSKKSGKFFEKRESCRNYIDEWLLESGLPRMKWPIDCGKRTSQLSMLANISALDREATEIIENERRKARETNNSANEERFYSFDYEDWKKDHLDSKKTKDLTSVFSSVANVAKISQLKTLQRDETSERKKTIDKKEEKKVNVNYDKTKKKTDCENININRKNSENVIKSEELPTHTKVTEPVKNTPQIRPVRPFSSWTCPQCTMENPSWKFICEMCNKWRPYSVNRTQVAPISPKEDSKLKRNFSSDDKQLKNEVQRTESELKIPLKTTLSDTLRVRQDLEKLRLARIRFFSRYQNNDGNSINSVDSIENKECEQEKNKPQKNLFYDDQDRKKLRQILKELKDSLPEKPVRLDQDTKTQEQNMKITNIGPYAMIDKTGVKEQPRNNEKKEHRISQDDTQSKLIKMESILSSTPSTSKQTNQILSTIKSTTTDVKENRKVTAIAINRLLKKLQTAIGNGQHHEAANIARELARLKVNCYMTRNIDSGSPLPNEKYSTFAISLYIKEKGECRGPIPLPINSTMTLADLKMKIFDEFKIPPYSQRWVFEKITLNNEIQSLENIGIDKPGIPLYLNIISEEKIQNKSTSLEDINLQKDQCKKYDQTEPPDCIEQPEIEENIETIHEKSEILQIQPPENELEKKTNLEIVQAEAVPPEPVASLSSQCSSIIKTDSIENIKNETVSLLKTIEEKIHSEQDIENIRLPEASSSKQNIFILPKFTQEYSKNEKNITKNEGKVRGWPCDLCTFINDLDAKTCIICNPTPSPSNFEKQTHTPPLTKKEPEKSMSYQELIALEKLDVILNNESFECSVCLSECPRGGGVVLRGCLHTFCCECLKQTIQFNTEAVVKCPYRDGDYSCESVLEEREIKALVSYEQYEKHLGRSITEAQNKIKNAFHCKTTDCRGWCIYEDNVNEFLCPVCCKTNCLTCRVIHMGLNCKQYQDMAKKEFENSADSSKTRSMLEEMIGKGEAIMCPTCEIILMKKWGCDWLRCSMCKTEICWVTRGPRWGPNGKGDTSGGCQCGVKGIKCHPKCNYCH